MSIERNPNDPYRTTPLDETRTIPERDDLALGADPERSGSGGRIAMLAAAVLLALGVVYFGMNASSTNPNAPASTASQTEMNRNTAQQTPAVRDVTPSNTQPGVTTGAAPSRPATPAPAPTDSSPATPSTR